MSNKPYDFLVSDKEPILYLEKSKIVMKDGFLCALNGEGIQHIAASGHLVLLLGAGTSISQEAAIFCSFNDCHIAFVRGGMNVHSFFMSGRYQDPRCIMNQAKLAQENKFEIAKDLLKIRFKLLKEVPELIQSIDNTKDINDLMLLEARWYKSLYKKVIQKYHKGKDVEFKRDFDSNDVFNERLNILNNALYSLTTAIILSCNLSPSIGFIHGTTRRGGLTFDIADILKPLTVMDLAFNNQELNNRQLMYRLFVLLKNDNFKLIKIIIEICLFMGGNKEKDIKKIGD